MSDDYTKEDLSRDLSAMVAAGILDISIREDGEWVYGLSETAMKMTDEERMEALRSMFQSHDETVRMILDRYDD